MKKTFVLLGQEIAKHFDEPGLCNRITRALNDAYEDGRNEHGIIDPMITPPSMFMGKPFSYWVELDVWAQKHGLDKRPSIFKWSFNPEE